jgi:hypothetical protein
MELFQVSDWHLKIFIYLSHYLQLECALGLQHKFNIPFMYLNTVGFYTGSVSTAGSPTPYSITPNFALALTDDMNFLQRVQNSVVSVMLQMLHIVSLFCLSTCVCSELRNGKTLKIPLTSWIIATCVCKKL